MFLRSAYHFLGYHLSLLFFGAFGLGLGLFCLLAAWLPATERMERFFQRLIHRLFALFHWWCKFARLIDVHYNGFERLPRGRLLLVANHPMLIDITCILARVPEAVCIFKPAIRRNPMLGAAARSAGYVTNDGGHDLVRAAADKVAAGHTLIVFPEGTRTPPDQALLPLKPGFVVIARRAGAPIQLLRIMTNSRILGKGRPWWRVPPLPARIHLSLGPLVPSDGAATPAEIAARIEAWFRDPPADPDAAGVAAQVTTP
jgi:1-acyl-sn-glycerol-3-phosphate acyltransferase